MFYHGFSARYLALFLILASIPRMAIALKGAQTPFDLKEGSYHHFHAGKELKRALQASDIINIEVHNPGKESALFFLVFEDEKSEDYWSRLNFKSSLAPGKNRLNFNLKRRLGERGSSRHYRGIDYGTLKKMYIVINPEDVKSPGQKYRVTSIGAEKAIRGKVPKEIRFFDFYGTGMPHTEMEGAVPVNSQLEYSKSRGSGFEMIKLWKKRDAQIEPAYLSSSLSVREALFRVDLKPGKYHFELVWDELGYWDTPFWQKRSLSINGEPKRLESRSSIRDFLKDYTRLLPELKGSEDVFTKSLLKLFPPVTGEFHVKADGIARFSVSGDETGASLNSLLIWPASAKAKALGFKKQLHAVSKASFERKYRQVFPELRKVNGAGKGQNGKKLRASFHPLGTKLYPSDHCLGPSKAEKVVLMGMDAGLDICVRANSLKKEPLIRELSDFISKDGRKIKSEKFRIYNYLYRAKSIDLNHETYSIRGEQLEESEHPLIELNGYATRHLRVELPMASLSSGEGIAPGEYSGSLSIEQGGKKTRLNISFTIIGEKASKLDVRAGFLGLSPFPHTYFESEDKSSYANRFYHSSYKQLKRAGLNLFTDVPSPQVNYAGASNKFFRLERSEFDAFLSGTQSDEIFLYGGAFPGNIFTGHQRNAGQSEKSFWENLSTELDKLVKRHTGKKLVYLYSDEATGYRNAVEEDTKSLEKYKTVFPKMKYGGFGNLYTWDQGKKLYEKWDYGFYSEIPSAAHFKKLQKSGQEIGVYNLCAEPMADLAFCFGSMLYRLKLEGVERYLEWHAGAIHNYPGFDLDGREADIALFYPRVDGEVSLTKRFVDASEGVSVYKKLQMLSAYLAGVKAPGLKHRKAKTWLAGLGARRIFPIKEFIKRFQSSYLKDVQTLDGYLKEFLIK